MPGLTLPPPAAQPLLGEGLALGVWRLRQALHAGDGGQWYRAEHALAADRNAAVLVMHRTERAAGVMLRFADQAGDLGRLSHPDIAVPSDSGVTAAGQPYLIVDWAEGLPITVAAHSLPLRERLELVVRLCEALRAAHQQGWLLGEIDPSMLWVGPGNRLKLMGLGLSRMPDPADPFERGATPGGLPGYLSPELRAGQPVSLASEAYGLGALLCVLVDGRLPSEIGDGVEDASLASSWPSLSTVQRLSLDALLRKSISPLIDRRHESAEALADDLRAWLADQGHSALALTPMPEVATPMMRVRPWPPARRRGWRLLIASVAMATLAVGGWASRLVLQERPASADTRPPPRG